jgi:hypothetical protein
MGKDHPFLSSSCVIFRWRCSGGLFRLLGSQTGPSTKNGTMLCPDRGAAAHRGLVRYPTDLRTSLSTRRSKTLDRLYLNTNVQGDHQGNETNTSALDMNGQVLNPIAQRSPSLLILNKDVSSTLDKAVKCLGYDVSQELSAECWIWI